MINNKSVDCYDLKTGDKTEFDNYYSAATHFGLQNMVVYKSISVAKPLLRSRYFLIFSDESVKNRRFILASQMNYYQMQLLPKKKKIEISRRRGILYTIKKGNQTN